VPQPTVEDNKKTHTGSGKLCLWVSEGMRSRHPFILSRASGVINLIEYQFTSPTKMNGAQKKWMIVSSLAYIFSSDSQRLYLLFPSLTCLKKLSMRWPKRSHLQDHRLINTLLAPAYWNALPIPIVPSPDMCLPRPVWHAVRAAISQLILSPITSLSLKKPSWPLGQSTRLNISTGSCIPGRFFPKYPCVAKTTER